jgi:hypothetical protein
VSPLNAIHVSTADTQGFVTAETIESAGSILGSPRDGMTLFQQDMPVYISLGEGQVRKGDRFDVVHVEADVRDPETSRLLGVHVDRIGWLEVTRVEAESSEAVIRLSSEEIARGDHLLPRVAAETEVEVRSITPPVEGQIASFPHSRSTMGQFDYVFLNRGLDHGLAVGSPLEVYEPHGVARDLDTGERHLLPDDVVGHLVVVSAEPATAVAVVVHTERELERGDPFRAPTQ